jgi:hypothetical protein
MPNGIPEGAGPCQDLLGVDRAGVCGSATCVGTRVVDVAGVKAGRRPPRRGLALTPARSDADFGTGADGQAGRLGGVGGAVCRTVVLTI